MSLLDNWVAIVFLIAAVALIALAGGYLLQMLIARRQAGVFALNLESELAKVEQKQRELIAEATKQANALRKNVEKQASDQRGEIRQRNREAKRREQRLDRRAENLEKREQELLRRESDLSEQQKQLSERQAEHSARLEEVAQLTRAQARTQLMEKVTEESRDLADQIVRGAEEQARQEADHRARWLVSNSLQRVASAVTQGSTTSAVKLRGDESKGQIIGREGRNIRAFEAATGVDLLIDDTPETVTLSSHDPIRREIARRTLTSLLEDGRVHPVSIEQHFNRARVAVRKSIREAGERACFEAKVPKLHQELVQLLGQLNFRQSYGQNVLSHSVEVAHLAGVLAGEMGADSKIARAGGLLHDVGKALSHEVDGKHAQIGAQRCRRYGVDEAVAHSIEAHHFDVYPASAEAFVVAAADAISSSRPGARRETSELFIKRLETLEQIANSHEGVVNSFALQAGRELRIAVDPGDVDELGALRIAREIAAEVEAEMTNPGQVRVTVIRETRAVEVAN